MPEARRAALPRNLPQRSVMPQLSHYPTLCHQPERDPPGSPAHNDPMNVALSLVGILIAALGIAGMVAPSLPIEVGRMASAEPAIYVVALVRVVVGAALFVAAPSSRAPIVIRILGGIIIAAGIATPLFGVDRSLAVVDWLSGQGPGFVRLVMVLPMALGFFIAYAFAPRKR